MSLLTQSQIVELLRAAVEAAGTQKAFVALEPDGIVINVGSPRRPRYESRPPCWVCWVPRENYGRPVTRLQQPVQKAST